MNERRRVFGPQPGAGIAPTLLGVEQGEQQAAYSRLLDSMERGINMPVLMERGINMPVFFGLSLGHSCSCSAE